MDGEMEDVMPAVSVERTQEGQVDSTMNSREHDEVIGFLLQDGTASTQVANVPDGAGDHMVKQLEGGNQSTFVVIKDEGGTKVATGMVQDDTSMDTSAESQNQNQAAVSLQGETSSQEPGTTTVQLMSGNQTLQVRVPAYQQAITLPDGTTAFIQQPVISANKGDSTTGISAMKLVEGQAIELEDGTMAYVQNTPKLGDGLQAIQLEDGTTAYISQTTAASVFNDGSTLEGTSLCLENLQSQVAAPQRMSSERALALGDKAYKCAFEGCGRLYTTQHHLKVHARSHTGDRPFRCEFAGCGKAFATGYGLKSHTRVHTGEKPYKCPEEACTKAFKTSGDLQKHVRTHTGERPFKCPFEGCTRSFTTSNIRKVHIRTHTGERPYVCTEEGCMKAFASATNYKNHIRIHTGEKPYVCTVSGCGKRFTEYSSLYKHHVVHTHSKPYICNHCGKNYRQTSTLAMHKRTAHGDDSSIEADAALLLQQTDGDLTADGKQQRIAFQLVSPGMLQATNASVGMSQDDSEGALIINTSEPQQLSVAVDSSQNTATTSVTPTVITDEQGLATLQVTQQTAQVAIQQLQQGHGITLASDQDGQQIYVVADPAQLEALQQIAQQQGLILPTATEGTTITVAHPVQTDETTKTDTSTRDDTNVDPLTADDEEENDGVLHYEVTAS